MLIINIVLCDMIDEGRKSKSGRPLHMKKQAFVIFLLWNYMEAYSKFPSIFSPFAPFN